MKSKKFKFYFIDEKYLNYLQHIDNNIPQKSNRPYIGIVLKVGEYNYYAPLTSPKRKHLQMKNNIDFLKIDSGNLGAINFNNMIPVNNNQIYEVILTNILDDKYKNLLFNQIKWCNANYDKIIRVANRLYNVITNDKIKNNKLSNRCCNFKRLEKANIEYVKSMQKEYVYET